MSAFLIDWWDVEIFGTAEFQLADTCLGTRQVFTFHGLIAKAILWVGRFLVETIKGFYNVCTPWLNYSKTFDTSKQD